MKARRGMKSLAIGTWAVLLGVVGIATGGIGSGDPAPKCSDVVAVNSFNGVNEGDDCYNACTSGASECRSGTTYKTCTTTTTSVICQKGTWKKNPDGTWGCWGSSGYHTVSATAATGSGTCGGGGSGET